MVKFHRTLKSYSSTSTVELLPLGRRQTARAEKAQTVKNFYSQGLSIDALSKGFCMSEEEIKAILSGK